MRRKKKVSYKYYSLGKTVRDSSTMGWNYCIEHITCPTYVKFTLTFHVIIYILVFGILNGPPVRELFFERIDPSTSGGWLLSNVVYAAVFVASKHLISRIDLKSSIILVIAFSVIILGQRPAWELIERKKTK